MAKREIIRVGKRARFLKLIKVTEVGDLLKFPEDVRKAISVEGAYLRVDSREYADGELIPFGSFVAWEPCTHERCPHGYNLWCKSNAQAQLDAGILEEVDGKYRQTKIVPLQAELFTGEIPQIFANGPTFAGQVKVVDNVLYLETPWGISSCEAGNGFAILYGICGEDGTKFSGMLDGNILTVGTPSFEDYFLVTEEGHIVKTLREYFDSL